MKVQLHSFLQKPDLLSAKYMPVQGTCSLFMGRVINVTKKTKNIQTEFLCNANITATEWAVWRFYMKPRYANSLWKCLAQSAKKQTVK